MESYGVIGMHIYRNSVSILLSWLCINLHDIPQVPCLFHSMLVKFFPTEGMGTRIFGMLNNALLILQGRKISAGTHYLLVVGCNIVNSCLH